MEGLRNRRLSICLCLTKKHGLSGWYRIRISNANTIGLVSHDMYIYVPESSRQTFYIFYKQDCFLEYKEAVKQLSAPLPHLERQIRSDFLEGVMMVG